VFGMDLAEIMATVSFVLIAVAVFTIWLWGGMHERCKLRGWSAGVTAGEQRELDPWVDRR
jgi:hypothetical protein